MANFTGTSGIDTFAGAGNVADTFTFAVENIQAEDSVAGGGGAVIDRLILTNGGTIGPAQLAVFSGIEQINLSAAGNTIALDQAFAATAFNQTVTIVGAAGDDVVDASALTAGQRLVVRSAIGADSLTGGAGDDEFVFNINQLTAADSVAGGLGRDTLTFANAGVTSAARLANVSSIEQIRLAAIGDSEIVIADDFVATADGARVTITAGAGDDTVDASGLTGVNAVNVASGSGADTLLAGAGDDTFRLAAADLTAADRIEAGEGGDAIEFTTGGTVAADAFANVSGVGKLILSSAGNVVTIDDAFAQSGDSVRIRVHGTLIGSDIVDAAGVVGESIRFITAGGADDLTGGGGGDEFQFTAGALRSNDKVDGGGGVDALQFTTRGTIAAGQLQQVSGIEIIQLAEGAGPANALTLDQGFQTRNPIQTGIQVIGTNGADSVDATAFVTTPFPSLNGGIVVTAGGGADTFSGGETNDRFIFATAEFNAADTVAGGGGLVDTLQFSIGGTLGAEAFFGVSGIERLQLGASNIVALSDALVASSDDDRIIAIGSFGGERVDATAVSAGGRVHFIAGAGSDRLLGGAGGDTFEVAAIQLSTLDVFDGAGGRDELVLTGGGAVAAGQLATTLTNVERLVISATPFLDLASEFSTSLTLDNGSFSDGRRLFVESRGSDVISTSAVSGARLITVEAGGGFDKLTGGATGETFVFAVDALRSANVIAGTPGDIVSGGAGAGTDILRFSTGGQIFAADLKAVSSMERFDFSEFGNTLLLSDQLLANNRRADSGVFQVVGGAGNDTLITPSANATTILFSPLGGDDTGLGGRGSDFFTIRAADLNNRDFFDGGAGAQDTLQIVEGDLNLDGIAQDSIRNFEKIRLSGANDETFTLTIDRDDVEAISASNVNVLGTTLDNVLIVEGSLPGDRINVEVNIEGNGLRLGGTTTFEGETYRFFIAGAGGPVVLAVNADFLLL